MLTMLRAGRVRNAYQVAYRRLMASGPAAPVHRPRHRRRIRGRAIACPLRCFSLWTGALTKPLRNGA